MKILCGHLTPLERRALNAMIAAGETTANSPKRRFRLGYLANGRAIFQALWAETDDNGRRVERMSSAEVQL